MNTIIETLADLDLPIPDDLARLAAIAARLEATDEPPTLADIAAAPDADTAARLFEDRINTLTAAETRRQETAELHRHLHAATYKTLVAAGDELVAKLRPRFIKAANHAAGLISKLGLSPTADTAIAAGLVDEYTAHGPALTELERLRTFVDLMGDRLEFDDRTYRHITRRGYYTDSMIPAVFLDGEDLDPDSYDRAAETYSTDGLAGLIAAGFRITLNTANHARRLVDRITSQRAAATPDPENTPTPDETDTATNRGLLELELRQRGGILAAKGEG